MSKINLTPNAGGTGTLTVTSPNTNTDYTLTLPSGTGTFNISGTPNEVPAGSNTAPSIYFTGDTNTGIYSPGSDTIAFTEGGTEAMRIDSSGNVGIGTSSPTTTLTIASSSTVGAGQPSILLSGQNNTERLQIRSAPTGGGAGSGTPAILLANSLGSITSPTAVTTGTNIGYYQLGGYDGTAWQRASWITGNAEETWSSTNRGSSLIFATTPIASITIAERMRIDSSGNVGIGSSSITRAYANYNQLNINGTSGATIQFLQNGTERGNIVVDANAMYLQSAIAMAFGVGGTGTGTERMRITGGGEVYIAGTTDQGAYNLQCNGTGVWGAGAYVNGSDARIKEDVAPIDSGLDVVEKLNPVTYRYKEDWSKDQSTQTGFIAQELLAALEGQNYVDGVVQQGGSEGYYSVAYQNIIPILTKAIQELNAKVEAQAAEIAALKAQGTSNA